MIPALASSQDLAPRLCALLRAHAPAHTRGDWPACFDQTCGYGRLTTLDSPDARGMCLTPTQDIMTCDIVRRKTKEKRGRVHGVQSV